ncbi:MAG: 2-oxoacid:acceptor oxidoreductase family protein [Candidatus Hodarchaeota archaeon]
MTYNCESYPEKDALIEALQKFCLNIVPIDATGPAEFSGSPASLNAVMLGALSKVKDFPISQEIVLDQIHIRFRERFREVNQRALDAGYDALFTSP